MNSNEFVSWLRGFVDACDEKLNEEQLSKIKSSLEEVTEVICMERVRPFIPQSPYMPYIPPSPGTGNPPGIYCSTNTGGVKFTQSSKTT